MQTGEMERLKEFGFKASKKDLDAVGGDLTKLKNAQTGKTIAETFGGGAEKLSKTASGKFSTITGNLQSGVQDAGLKLLERFTPVLDRLLPLSEQLAEKLPGLVSTVADELQPIFQAFGDVMTNIGIPVLNLAGSILKNVVLPAFEMAAKLIGGVAKAVGGPFKRVVDKVKSGLDKLGNVLDKIANFNPFKSGGGSKTSKTNKNNKGGKNNKNRNATGTSYYGGGITMWNEHGDEMLRAPVGTEIIPAEKTATELKKRARWGGAGGGNITVNVDARGSNMSESDRIKSEQRIMKMVMDAFNNIDPVYA